MSKVIDMSIDKLTAAILWTQENRPDLDHVHFGPNYDCPICAHECKTIGDAADAIQAERRKVYRSMKAGEE